MLPDGRRLHLQHGPIDLVIEAGGPPHEVASAYGQAIDRFGTILQELVSELPRLRRPLEPDVPAEEFGGPTPRRMTRAVGAHRDVFITPMAAVAGAVADEILAAMLKGCRLTRAYVNNGGDIALHLQPGQRYTAGLPYRSDSSRPDVQCTVTHDMPVRGIATSGHGGRSFSLGIADTVTVLARDAASADAAATLIANAVNVDHPAVRRATAESLDPDSDLGKLMVTTEVGPLDEHAVSAALVAGVTAARRMQSAGLIEGAVLSLGRHYRVVGAGRAVRRPVLKRPTRDTTAQVDPTRTADAGLGP
jgi:ApbE superfamily uncharacterized protein (UPF0280 family)